MTSWVVGLITFGCVFGGALAGMWLRGVLPKHHLSEDSKDVVKLVTGLLATLSALVLGLLIASAKNSFDTINSELKESAARVILLDRTLAQYGTDAKETREALRNAFAARIQQLLAESRDESAARDSLRRSSPIEEIEQKIQALSPATEAQRSLKSRALQLSYELAQARWNAFEQLGTGTPLGLLVVLVCWLAVMFAGFGLFAPINNTTTAVLAIGALSVATAVFLIEEMNDPVTGVIRVSSLPMRNALAILGERQP